MAFHWCRQSRFSLLAIWILAAMAAFSGKAAAQPHLRQAPSVKEVLAKVKGNDSLDTAARRHGAFRQLNGVLLELCEGGEFAARCTPDERALMEMYARAAMQADEDGLGVLTGRGGPRYGPDSPAVKWRDIKLQYDSERDRMQLLGFWPDLKAVYQPFYDDKLDRRRKMQAERVRDAGIERRRAPGQAPQPAGPAAKPGPLPAPDPSVEKAHSKKIDTTVLGMRIGEALAHIPACPASGDVDEAAMGVLLGVGVGSEKTCVAAQGSDAMALGMLTALVGAAGGSTGGRDLVAIRLADAKCPAWVRASGGCSAQGLVKGGLLLGVIIMTGNSDLQKGILKELKKKYGSHRKPTQARKCTNDYGAGPPAVDVYEWFLPGLHVRYEPLSGNCVQGGILIETETSHQLSKDAAKQTEESQPKL